MATELYTGEQLITTVRNRAKVGDDRAEGWQDADILLYVNELQKTRLLPALLTVREEFNKVKERTTLVASQTAYPMPERSAGRKLRHVFYVNTNSKRRELDLIKLEDLHRYTDSAARPRGFYFDWDHIYMVPDIGASTEGSIELHWFMQPSNIVKVTETRIISSIAAGVVTLTATVPTTWTTANKFDIHSPHSGASLRNFSLTASVVSGTDITFTEADIDGSAFGKHAAAAGDYVTLEGECAVPFAPRELHPILAKMTAEEMVRADGDIEGAAAIGQEIERDLAQAIAVYLEDRVEGKPQVIRNAFSFIRRGNLYGINRANEF